jgi:hypothetical protein
MDTRELLQTLDCTVTAQRFHAVPQPHINPKIEINWMERLELKNKFLKDGIRNLILLSLLSVVLIIVPFYMANASLGKSVLLGMTPMFLLVLSWIVPFVKFWDKRMFRLLPAYVVPVRIALVIGYVALIINSVEDISRMALVSSMMFHWILYSPVEIGLMYKMPRVMHNPPEDEPSNVM